MNLPMGWQEKNYDPWRKMIRERKSTLVFFLHHLTFHLLFITHTYSSFVNLPRQSTVTGAKSRKAERFNNPGAIYRYGSKVLNMTDSGEQNWSRVWKLLSEPCILWQPVYPKEFKNGHEIMTYTVEKVAWWFLKNNQDPANEGAMHPELHDDYPEARNNNNEDYSSQENIGKEAKDRATKKTQVIRFSGFELEYFGRAGLEAMIRFPGNFFLPVMVLEPGMTYDKPDFKAECRICDNVTLIGRQAYAHHLQSESHGDNFRAFSMRLASYPEVSMKSYPMQFAATVMTYLPKRTVPVGPHGLDS